MKQVVNYFKTCFEADNGKQSLWNILAKDHEHVNVLSREQKKSVTDSGVFSLAPSDMESLTGSVFTYRREKTLLYGSCFVVGRRTQLSYGKTSITTVCAPVFIHLAEIAQDDTSKICVDVDSYRWNTPLLNYLLKNTSGKSFQEVLQSLSSSDDRHAVMNQVVGSCGISALTLMDNEVTGLTSLIGQLDIDDLKLVHTSAILLTKRSINSSGIIDELTSLSRQATFSNPMALLYPLDQARSVDESIQHKTREDGTTSDPLSLDMVPGHLSAAQKQAHRDASDYCVSLLQGPPGTGKSYTIASIVLERFLRGESVLVVSKNEHAVDVIGDKIEKMFGLSPNAVMRVGASDYHKRLKQYIDSILAGDNKVSLRPEAEQEIHDFSQQVEEFDEVFHKRLALEVELGQFDLASSKSPRHLWAKLRALYYEHKGYADGSLYEMLLQVQDKHAEREKLLSEYIDDLFKHKVARCLFDHKKELRKFRKGIAARSSARQEDIFSRINFSVLLSAMPIWLCSLDSLHRALPLIKNMFDLVIFDEASQCDVASSIPALYRAKQALIVGDPKQLRHVSFLARTRQEALAEACGLDYQALDISYRDESLVDLVEKRLHSGRGRVMLDEHFRSTANIIHYSNQRFYNGGLRIMTETPHSKDDESLQLHSVDNARRLDGVNLVEASAVVAKIREYVDEQSVIPVRHRLSIGVVSFFRDQAEAIQNMLFENFTIDEISCHGLRAGTPYAFQGEERDIVILSCAVDRESGSAVYNYINREDVFNVAVTRARKRQLIFLSARKEDLPPKSLLFEYLQLEQRRSSEREVAKEKNALVKVLSNNFSHLGYQVLVDYSIAGIVLDVLLVLDGNTLAVDLIGFPGDQGLALSQERYRVLERVGLHLYPLSYREWAKDEVGVVKMIEDAFVKIKLANVAQRLGEESLNHHWKKLVALSAGVAASVRDIEADIIAAGLHREHEQLGRVVDQYKRTLWVLGEKLSTTELTYVRYTNASEQVFLNCVENFSNMVVVMKSSASLTQADSPVVLEIDRIYGENESAIEGLEALAYKWSKTKTFKQFGNSEMDDALKELSHLNDNIDNYAG